MWNMIASAGKGASIVNQNIRKSNIFGHNIYVYGMINWRRMLESVKEIVGCQSS